MPRASYMAEPLEDRTLLANLHINDVYVADRNGVELTSIAAGEVVYLQVEFSTTDLPASANYTVDVTLNGQTYSPSLTWGAGLAGTSNWVLRWGTWLPTSGVNSGSALLDADNDVAETNGGDNAMNISAFVGQTFAAGFNKPLEGNMGTDWLFVNYVDINHGADVCNDYLGGNYCYDGHNGWDWSLANFRAMDAGYSIFASAGGTVTDVHDGEFDRQVGSNSNDGNYVKIDHGGGWSTTYWHFRRDSITVTEGQVVAANHVLGLAGSSGNSTDAHLHWGVYYNGRQVEPAVAAAINLNFAQPYPDTNPAIIDSGITDYDVSGADLKEGPDLQNHFLPIADQVRYWARLGGLNSTDDIRIEWDQPGAAGNFVVQNWADVGQIRYSSWEAFITLPAIPAAGTWTVRAYINNVLEDTQTFVVGAATPEARMYFNNVYFVDGRTTPRNFGTILQGNGTQPELSFTIANEGNASLDITSVTVPAGFTIVNGLSDIPAGGTNILTLRLDDNVAGYKSGFVNITTNDPNSAVQSFRIEGLVKSPSVAVNELLDNGIDTIYLRRNGTNARIWVNKDTLLTPTFTFPIADMAGFTINSLGGDDVVTADYTAGVPYHSTGFSYNGGADADELRFIGQDINENFVFDNGDARYVNSDGDNTPIAMTSVQDFVVTANGGNDIAYVGTSTGTRQIDAAIDNLTFNGGAGTDQIFMDDTDDTLPDSYTFAGSTFTKPGGNISYSNTDNIRLDANPENNTITLDLPNPAVTFFLFGGAGADHLIYDDRDDAAGNDLYNIASAQLTKTAVDPVNYQEFESLTLHANDFNNTIVINSTIPGFELTINGNDGSDFVNHPSGNVGASGPGLLTVNGGAGDTDSLSLDDSTFGLAQPFTITSTNVSRPFWSGANYSGLERLTLQTNDLASTIHVNSTPANLTVNVNANGGSDTINVNETGADSEVVVVASDGLDTVNVNSDNAGSATALFVPTGAQHLGHLTIGTGGLARLAAGGNRTLTVTGLTFTGATPGQLDLTNNDMIVHATAGTRQAVYDDILARLQSGLNASGTFWAGNGINSSTAAADSGGTRTAIGAILNDFAEAGLPFGAIYDLFNGLAVNTNDILLKYTYFGDADVSGVVDGTDYFLIDQAFNGAPNGGGWLNGDFDFSGALNGTDYFLIDNAFTAQGAPLAAQAPFSISPLFSPDDDDDAADVLN